MGGKRENYLVTVRSGSHYTVLTGHQCYKIEVTKTAALWQGRNGGCFFVYKCSLNDNEFLLIAVLLLADGLKRHSDESVRRRKQRVWIYVLSLEWPLCGEHKVIMVAGKMHDVIFPSSLTDDPGLL